MKYYLNLDPGFNPSGSRNVISHHKFPFPGGEQHIKIIPNLKNPNRYEDTIIITQRYTSSDDIMEIFLASDALKRLGYEDVELFLPYFPAARQDRVCNEGEPLTVKVFADLINACGFTRVTIGSPHSEVTPALLNDCKVIDLDLKFIDRVVYHYQGLYPNTLEGINVICPDAGAGKRVEKVARYLVEAFPHVKFNMIRCEKVRDVRDGSLKDFFVQADTLNNVPGVIVDDICAMGGTFIGLSKKLKEKNSGPLSLFTCHYDCLAGLENVSPHFDKVYSTNSKMDDDPAKLPHNVEILEIYI